MGLVVSMVLAPLSAGADAPGGLAQLPAPAGCLVGPAFEGAVPGCTVVSGLGQGHGATLSPDGKNLYAISYYCCTTTFGQTIVIFDRDPQTGALTKKPVGTGCHAHDNSGGGNTECTDARALYQPRGVAITPDGKNLYVASTGSNGIAAFTRNPDGTLQQKAGTAGCIVENNTLAGDAMSCADGHMLEAPQNLTVSPDGKHLYVASSVSDAVATFGINSLTGALVQAPGTCVQDTGVSPCSDGRALDGAFAVEMSPDGSRVYAGTITDSSVTTLLRDPNTGALIQATGVNGCGDDDGLDGCNNLGGRIGEVYDLQITSDGSHLYAAIGNKDRILLFDRQVDGTVLQRSGPGGCISSESPTPGDCAAGRQLDFVHGLGLSPDQRHLYAVGYNSSGLIENARAGDGSLAASQSSRGCYSSAAVSGCTTGSTIGSNRVALVTGDGRFVYTFGDFSRLNVFRRDAAAPQCSDGAATVAPGQSAELGLTCSDADGDALTISIVTPPSGGSLAAVDQAQRKVTFTASSGFSGRTTFTFRAESNGAVSNTSTFAIDVPAQPAPPPSPPPPPPATTPPKPRCVVPKLKGKTLKAASASLKRSRCRTGKVTRAFSAKVKKGRVMRQSQRAGRRLANGARVNLVLSKGRKR